MIENLGLNILSYFFHPLLQQERDRKMWIEEQAENNGMSVEKLMDVVM